MKKIIGITLALLLVTMASNAQVTAVQTAGTDQVKKCVPTKACAEKAGMTLTECQKKCAGKSSTTAEATAVASVSMVAETEAGAKKCCASIKECAAKSGMTVKECLAKCTKGGQTAEAVDDVKTKVAAATLVNEIEEIAPAKTGVKKCCKSAAACKKKQG